MLNNNLPVKRGAQAIGLVTTHYRVNLLDGMLDRTGAGYLRKTILLICAAATVYLIGNGTVGLWDRDEPRYAQTSRQMLQSGDWVVPKLLDEVREKKPVFIYWCQATAMKFLGDSAFAARLPSVVFVTATAIVLAVVLFRSVGRRRALWTSFVFSSSVLVILAAKMSITDGVLLFFATIAQLCLYAIWRGRGTWTVFILLGLVTGFGILTKGPVVPAFLALTAIVLLILRWSDGKRFPAPASKGIRATGVKWMVAVCLAAGVCVPWLIAIEHRIPGYLVRTFRTEVVERGAEAQEGHGGYPGFYLLTIWLFFLPWVIFLPFAAVFAWKRRHLPHIRFALAASIGPWVAMEIYVTKLPHYLLPIYPALAFLVAEFLVRNRNLRKAAVVLGVSMLAIFLVGYGMVLPFVSPLRISQRIAQILVNHGAVHPGDAIMIDYKEPSLAFHQGGTIRPARDDRYLEHTPQDQWPRWIVVSRAIWDKTPQSIRQQASVIATVHGLDYAGADDDKHHIMDVLVVEKK